VERPERVGDRHAELRPRRAPRLADELGDERVRIVGLVPGDDLDEPVRPGNGPLGRVALEPRDDEPARAARRDDEHREPLERHRVVAREVPQVGTDADEERGQSDLGDGSPGRHEPAGEANGGDLRARLARRGHRPATARPSHRSSVAGPSSNSFR